MNHQTLDAAMLGDLIRELEETVEKANLLALELALKAFEDEESGNTSIELDGIGQLAGQAAYATEEVERLVRRLKAA